MKSDFPKWLQKILPALRYKEFGIDHPHQAGQIGVFEPYGVGDAELLALLALCQKHGLRFSIHAEGQHAGVSGQARTLRVVIFRLEDREHLESVRPRWTVSNPWAPLEVCK